MVIGIFVGDAVRAFVGGDVGCFVGDDVGGPGTQTLYPRYTFCSQEELPQHSSSVEHTSKSPIQLDRALA